MSFLNSRKKGRRYSLVVAGLGGLLWTASALLAQTPNMTGSWEMDAAKSQVTDGRTVALVIESVGNKLKLVLIVRDKDGKETKDEFTCAADGKECEFDEGGHRSKISMWFSGNSLNVAKTDGPAGDVVNEWKLQTSPDKKKLTLGVTHIDPDAPAETLLFSKKSSST